MTQKQSSLSQIYLLLILIGTGVPVYFFILHFAQQGSSITLFFQQAFANQVASGLVADLLISSSVFWVLGAQRLKKTNQKASQLIPFVFLNIFVGLSCALPAFLYWQEKKNHLS